MRILITNDDSISSSVLPRFVKWAMGLGEVTVVVPKHEQSGKSQAIDFRNAVEVKRVDLVDGCEAYTVDSTPADCVRFAVTGLKREYDVVFSGINCGYNIGDDIAYSGTIGAIFEASRLGLKAIAFSTGFDTFDYAMSEIDKVYSFINENRLLDKVDLLNVNFPLRKSRGISITRQGGMFFSDDFVDCGNDMYKQVGEPVDDGCRDISIDIPAIREGYVSISPLTSCKTDLVGFEKLKNMNLQ